MKNNNFIIITSIFSPTEAVKKFSSLKNYQTIVVGDKKTPADWQCDNVQFISADDQQTADYAICQKLPWNHYTRKMIGYIHAMRAGANMIIDTDDDNIPKDNWEFPSFTGKYETLSANDYVNVYQLFTDKKIWPRGLPLKKILSKPAISTSLQSANIGIWQFLADDDPDVDAIYRLTINEPVFFNERAPVVLDENAICPFNSQNTAFCKEAFPLLYLPAFVNFRYTDILRGLIAQPILWQFGFRLGFGHATVRQARNPHDYLHDFIDEFPMYYDDQKIIPLVKNAIVDAKTIPQALELSYQALLEKNIVKKEECELLTLWLKDIAV